MKSLFPLVIYTIYILRSTTSASIEKYTQTERCVKENRLPPYNNYGCGVCIPGYSENSQHLCVSVCPTDEQCKRERREGCIASSGSTTCGHCLDDYLEVEGVCVTEQEINQVIKRIQVLLDQSESGADVHTEDVNERAEVKDTEQSANEYLDKKSESTVGVQSVQPEIAVQPDPPSDPPSDNTDDKTIEESNTVNIHLPATNVPVGDADKRVHDSTSAQKQASLSKSQSVDIKNERVSEPGFSKLVFFVVVLSVSLLCLTSIVIAGTCWYRLHKQRKAMETSEYAGYGGDDYPKKSSMSGSESGDRKLAHSAQMYHYQHHKQQMMALEKSMSDKLDESDQEDPEENEDGNYTVYECPGLAPAGEMEVSNPLFQVNNNKNSPSPTKENAAVADSVAPQ